MVGPAPDSWAVEPQDAGARLVLPGIWRLRLPTAWDGISHANAYVIEREDDGVVLVDCGCGGDPTYARAFETALAQTGHAVEDVRVLAATHVHSDHVGLAPWVLERCDGELWAHPDDAHLYDATREPERIEAARTRRARLEGVPEARLPAFGSTREEVEAVVAPVAPDHPLVAGTFVESAHGRWEVLETPGHAPSHVCLLNRELRCALVGDLICAAFVPFWDYGYSADPVAETFASLDRLDAEELAVALPGHGRPIEDVGAVVAMTRDGLERHLAATRAAVLERPAGAYELTERIFGEEGDFSAVTHMTEVLGYLAHLRRRGEVVRELDADGRYRYRPATPSRSNGGT